MLKLRTVPCTGLMRYIREQVGGPDGLELQVKCRLNDSEFYDAAPGNEKFRSKSTFCISSKGASTELSATLHASEVKRYLCNGQRFIEGVTRIRC